ncbi:MAG: bifunctional transcriptional activator/DNA repair enzyme AdaA [Caulobacteraceae bacterium]
MKEPGRISDNEKWQAVIRCDKSYDGKFFYSVKTTGIFCRPSCKSKTPVRSNVAFFDNAAKAIESGFRPCKRCCPDKISFEPDLELIKKAIDIFDAAYNRQIDLSHVSRQLGVSANHLIRLFKQHRSLTPTRYIAKIRVDKAEELLKQSDMDVLEIAYEVGFKSLSNFYKCFKEQTGHTPNESRTKHQAPE